MSGIILVMYKNRAKKSRSIDNRPSIGKRRKVLYLPKIQHSPNIDPKQRPIDWDVRNRFDCKGWKSKKHACRNWMRHPHRLKCFSVMNKMKRR